MLLVSQYFENVGDTGPRVGTICRTIPNRTDFSGKASQQSSTGGAVYTRSGRKMCPGNGTDLLYWGECLSNVYECVCACVCMYVCV